MNSNKNKQIVQEVLSELKRKNLIFTAKNSYESTEKILFGFKALPEALELIEDEIKNLQKELNKLKPENSIKSKTLVLNEEEGTYVYGNETLETRISELKQIAAKTKSQIRLVNRALDKIRNDKYYDIIELYYFQGQKIPVISELLDKSDGTISNNKNRLINQLKVYIFPDTYIKELQ